MGITCSYFARRADIEQSASSPIASPSAASSNRKPKRVIPPDARVLQAQSLAQGGKVTEALRQLNLIIKDAPSCARAYVERGNIRVDVQAKAQEERENRKSRPSARQEQTRVKDLNLAVGDFTEAIGIQENYVQALIGRSTAFLMLGELESSVKSYASALSLDPENGQLKQLKLRIQRAREGREAAGTEPDATPPAVATSLANRSHVSNILVPPSTPQAGHFLTIHDQAPPSPDPFAGLDTPKSPTKKLCSVCMDKERGCRLKPCLHSCLCVDCAGDLKKRGFGCPICSVKIQDVEVGEFTKTYAMEEAAQLASLARGVKSPLGSACGDRPGGVGGLPSVMEESGTLEMEGNPPPPAHPPPPLPLPPSPPPVTSPPPAPPQLTAPSIVPSVDI